MCSKPNAARKVRRLLVQLPGEFAEVAMPQVSFWPSPSGSSKVNWRATSANSSTVVGTDPPTASSQSPRATIWCLISRPPLGSAHSDSVSLSQDGKSNQIPSTRPLA